MIFFITSSSFHTLLWTASTLKTIHGISAQADLRAATARAAAKTTNSQTQATFLPSLSDPINAVTTVPSSAGREMAKLLGRVYIPDPDNVFIFLFLSLPSFIFNAHYNIKIHFVCSTNIYIYVYKEQIEKGGFYVSLCIGRLALLLSQANGH